MIVSWIPFPAIALAIALAMPCVVRAAPLGSIDSPDSIATPGFALQDSIARPSLRDSVLLLPEIRVDTLRAVPALRHVQPTAFVTELRTRDGGRALSSVGETLAHAAGIRVLQYGGLGAFSTVSIRGAPAAHTAVLIDGEPLQNAAHSVTSLSDVPAAAIGRIEVSRGSSPLAWGLPAPAGAVNLVTLPVTRGLDARYARGSFGTWEGATRAGTTYGPLAVAINVGYQGSRGDYDFFDDNGTPYEASDDSTTERINNRFGAAHAIGALTWTPRRGLRVRAREDWFEKTQGLPGLATIQSSSAERSIARSVTRLDFERDGARAWPVVRVRGSLRRDRARLDDRNGELGLGRWHTDDHFAGERAAADLEWPALPLGASAKLGTLGLRSTADASVDRARTTNSADAYPDPPNSRRDARGAALMLQIHAPGGRALLHAGRRWDRIRDELRGLATAGVPRRIDVTRETSAPQLGARVQVTRALELRGNWTDAERVPDFSELFGDGGTIYGNLTLRPERTRTWDAGTALTWRAGEFAAHAQWAHFETRSENLIYFFPAVNGVRALNLERARTRGDEVELSLGPLAGFRATAACTRQSGEDRSTTGFWVGKQLPLLPSSQIDARLSWSARRFGGYADAFHLGPNYLDRSNRTRIDARTLLGAGLWATLPGALRLTLEGRNLGDERITDVAGYPLPGRTLFVALESSVAFPEF